MALAVALVAVAVLLWSIGLVERPSDPRRGDPVRDDPESVRSPAQHSLDLLVSIVPPAGAQGCPHWRDLARLAAPRRDLSGPLGFEALRLVFERTDGAIHWRAAVLLDTSGEAPLAVAMLIECRPQNDAARAEALDLAEEWPAAVEPLGARHERLDSWRLRWRDPWAAADLEGRTRTALGGHVPVDVPDSLRDDYELLLDPLRGIVFQPWSKRAEGDEPGRAAIERLLAAGRDELVRNVLRGLDPEGRVYAVEALLQRLQPTPEDELAMAAVLALEIPVRTTPGDVRVTARAALGLAPKN